MKKRFMEDRIIGILREGEPPGQRVQISHGRGRKGQARSPRPPISSAAFRDHPGGALRDRQAVPE